MSKGIETPNFSELLKDLQSISEIKERVNTIDLIRLKELIIQLDKMLFDRFKFINDFLCLNPDYSIEHCKLHFSQYGFNYNNLEQLKELIQSRINYQTENQPSTFNNPIFDDIESKQFFEFLIKEWFNNIPKPKTAISFVFHLMRTTDNDLSTEFKGLKYTFKDVRQLDFALYWNENNKELHKHKYSITINFKTARLKTFNEIPTATYINKLNKFIEKFESLK